MNRMIILTPNAKLHDSYTETSDIDFARLFNHFAEPHDLCV